MDKLIAIRLLATAEISKYTDAVSDPLPPNKKHQPGRKKGDVIYIPYALAKEAVKTGRWEYVDGCPPPEEKTEKAKKKEKSE